MPEIAHGKFKTDGKEQQDYPDFSQALHFVHAADQAEPMGARQHAGQKKSHNSWYAYLVTEEQDNNSQPQIDHNIIEQVYRHESRLR